MVLVVRIEAKAEGVIGSLYFSEFSEELEGESLTTD